MRKSQTPALACLAILVSSACDKASEAQRTPSAPAEPSTAAAPLANVTLPQPSESAHFEYVPGHENWKMPEMRGDANYKLSYSYQSCMKARPHRSDEAAVCKELNDACVDTWRSQEACDGDRKGSDDPYRTVKGQYQMTR
jgi:hypothetical protein